MIAGDHAHPPGRPLAPPRPRGAAGGLSAIVTAPTTADLPGECDQIVSVGHDPGRDAAHGHGDRRRRSPVVADLADLRPRGRYRARARVRPRRRGPPTHAEHAPAGTVALLDLLGLEPPTAGPHARALGATTAPRRRPIGAGRDGPVHARPAHATARTRSSPARPARARASCCRRWSARWPRRAPPDRLDLPARRLQGRRGVQGLRRAAAHRRLLHRPRRAPRAARPRLAERRAAPARGAPARRRRRRTSSSSKSRDPRGRAAEPRHRLRRVRLPEARGTGVRRRRRRHRAARPQPRHPPRARHATPERRRRRPHPREHEPAHRAARQRRPREHRRDRAPRRRRACRARTPGRALVRTGHGEVQEIQTAFAGNRGPRRAPRRARISCDPFPSRGAANVVLDDTDTSRPTDLRRLVVRSARPPARPVSPRNRRRGSNRCASTTHWRRWPRRRAGACAPCVRRPRRARPPTPTTFLLDLADAGHLLVYGAAGAGKTTFLRTLAASLAPRHTPSELVLYRVRLREPRAPRRSTPLPHCAGVVVAAATASWSSNCSPASTPRSRRRRELLGRVGAGSLARAAGPGRVHRRRRATCHPTSSCCSTTGEGSPPRSKSVDRGRTDRHARAPGRRGSGARHPFRHHRGAPQRAASRVDGADLAHARASPRRRGRVRLARPEPSRRRRRTLASRARLHRRGPGVAGRGRRAPTRAAKASARDRRGGRSLGRTWHPVPRLARRPTDVSAGRAPRTAAGRPAPRRIVLGPTLTRWRPVCVDLDDQPVFLVAGPDRVRPFDRAGDRWRRGSRAPSRTPSASLLAPRRTPLLDALAWTEVARRSGRRRDARAGLLDELDVPARNAAHTAARGRRRR